MLLACAYHLHYARARTHTHTGSTVRSKQEIVVYKKIALLRVGRGDSHAHTIELVALPVAKGNLTNALLHSSVYVHRRIAMVTCIFTTTT